MSRARGSMAPIDGEARATVEAFAASARRFCNLIGGEPPLDRRERARRLAIATASLYASALALLPLELHAGEPEDEAEEDDDTIDVPLATAWADLGLGPRYRVMVEPYRDDRPATAALQDDLEEVLAEVVAGLAMLEEDGEAWASAGIEWRASFATGWGRHLASLIYAAHAALAAE
jgi:hypothetical protein